MTPFRHTYSSYALNTLDFSSMKRLLARLGKLSRLLELARPSPICSLQTTLFFLDRLLSPLQGQLRMCSLTSANSLAKRSTMTSLRFSFQKTLPLLSEMIFATCLIFWKHPNLTNTWDFLLNFLTEAIKILTSSFRKPKKNW